MLRQEKKRFTEGSRIRIIALRINVRKAIFL